MAKITGFTKRDIKNINLTVGINLAAARRNAGMTQTDVMVALWGVSNSRNRISEIENGKKDLTLIDLLVFQKLYSQSLDYICGLSVEPEIDALAGTVNHVVVQAQSLVEMLVTEMSSVVVGHIKSINKNDHAALLEQAKEICLAVKEESARVPLSHRLLQATARMMESIMAIEAQQKRQKNAVYTQMLQITERVDKEDRHRLITDASKEYQYSLPLPVPECVGGMVTVGVNYQRVK